MAYRVTITLEGQERPLLTYFTNYFRSGSICTNYKDTSFPPKPLFDLRSLNPPYFYDVPYPQTYGGLLRLTLEATDNDSVFYDWMKPGEMRHVEIKFYRTHEDDDMPFYRIELFDTFLVGMGEHFEMGRMPLLLHLELSPAIFKYNKNIVFRKSWYLTDIDAKTVAGSSEQQEELLVCEVKGVDETIPGKKEKFKVTRFSTADVSDDDKKKVCWAIKVDNKTINLPESECKGEEIEIEIKEEWAGKEILVMPYLRKPWEKVAQKTKVSYKYAISKIEFIDELTQGSDNISSYGTQKGLAYGRSYKLKVKEYKDNLTPDKAEVKWGYSYTDEWGVKVTYSLDKEKGAEIVFKCDNLILCGKEITFFAYLNDKENEGKTTIFHHYRFLHISRKSVKEDVEKRMKEPFRINQGGTSLCGIACILYLFAKNNPSAYKRFILSLHQKGTAQHNLYITAPDKEIIERKDTNGLNGADYIGLASLRNNENRAYKGGNEQISAINWPWTMEKLCKVLLGYNEVKSSDIYTPVKPVIMDIPETKINTLNNYKKKEYDIILLVDSDLIQDILDFESVDYHWIVLESEINITRNGLFKPDDVAFKAYSWARVDRYRVTVSHFSRNYYGYIALK